MKRMGKKKKEIQWMNGMNECSWDKMRSPWMNRWMGWNEESMDEFLRGKMRSPWMNDGWLLEWGVHACFGWMMDEWGGEGVHGWMDGWMDEGGVTTFFGFLFFPPLLFLFPFFPSLLSCALLRLSSSLSSPLLSYSLLPTPLPLFESSSSRNINSLLLFLLQERNPKSSGFCRVFVCTKASSQKKDVNSDSLQSFFFLL